MHNHDFSRYFNSIARKTQILKKWFMNRLKKQTICYGAVKSKSHN